MLESSTANKTQENYVKYPIAMGTTIFPPSDMRDEDFCSAITEDDAKFLECLAEEANRLKGMCIQLFGRLNQRFPIDLDLLFSDAPVKQFIEEFKRNIVSYTESEEDHYIPIKPKKRIRVKYKVLEGKKGSIGVYPPD